MKQLGIKCPVCEAKRKLLAQGFTEEDLSVQGKFGLIPVFNPKLTSNVKVVVFEVHFWTELKHTVSKPKNGLFSQRVE